MKLGNALVLAFAALLFAQLPVRKYYGEPYPMIVLPTGSGVYEHKADTVATSDWEATAYASATDSARVDESALFPGPVNYDRYMYSSLMGAGTTSERWTDASKWIQKNIAGSTPLPRIDSLCIHRIEKSVRLEEGDTEIRYKRSSCYDFSSDQ